MPGKRKRTPNDAQWCLNNSNTLTVKNFVIEFVTRYQNILSAHFSRDRRENLLQDLDGWKKSLDAKIFWKEQARKQIVAETRVRCSAFVDSIIHEEGPQGSSINNDDSNNNVESSSSSSTNNRDRGTNINNSDDSNHNDRSISERNHSSSNSNINSNNESNSNSNNGNTGSCNNNSGSNTSNNNNSSSSESSNPGTLTPTKIHTPFIIKHVNVTDTFKQYQEYISSHYPTFTIEKDLQEIMAMANILFLAPDDHSDCKKKIFQLSNLDLMCTEMLQELKILDTQENKELFNDDEFIKVTRIINEVAEKTKTIRMAKLELLTLAASMEGGNKGSVVKGVANLLTKLPRVEILNMDKLGEVELQTTYYDALLSELIADQDKNEQTDIRSDAIVSMIMQHNFGHPVGFGEVKPGNSSTTKHSVSLDVLRLGIASKRAIDKWKLNSCFGFMINGFDLTFFITKKQHENCYTMLEIAQFTYASSLLNLHSFVSIMNLNKLTKVGQCFWNECHATNVTRDDEAGAMANDDAGVVPVSKLYALISRTCN
ncbi:hypothetical protein F4703DRAFT_1796558 [Phycomyces blakesleeanus]